MNNYYIAAILIWLGMTFLSRRVNDKANKILDIDKKAALVYLASGNKTFSLVSVIGIVVLFFLCIKNEWLNPILSYVLYFVLLISSFIISSYLILKKLQEHQYPDAYIKSYLISAGLRGLGIALFVAILTWSALTTNY
jgi:hypothetical protein